MTLPHPVQVVFDCLTHIVQHALPQPTQTNAACECCNRPSHLFGNQGYKGKSYGLEHLHCAACESFNVSDVALMGVERNAKTLEDGTVTGVGHKFGMLSGSGCIVTASGKSVLFTPPGTYKKLPPALLERLTVVECTIGGQLEFISKANFDYPLVYIQNFGRKTNDLIKGLRWSVSSKAIVVCSDDGNDSTKESANTIDLDKLLTINSIRQAIPKKFWTEFKTAVQRLSRGDDTPEVFTQTLKKLNRDELRKIYRLLPLDPHQRLAIISQVDNI